MKMGGMGYKESSGLSRTRRQGPPSFPGPLRVHDETIAIMKAAVEKALGEEDRLAALKRLDEARRAERAAG
jgi:hypothetical protein